MEFIELIQGLSSGDLLTRIATIARIIHEVKKEKSSALVNTIAFQMAGMFSQCSNLDRYFISMLFEECKEEMCMIKNKLKVFRSLTIVFDRNDPIASSLALKILGFLAPLLEDLLEIHHKILLMLKSDHLKIRAAAQELLPKISSFLPDKYQEQLPRSHSLLSKQKIVKRMPTNLSSILKTNLDIDFSELSDYESYLIGCGFLRRGSPDRAYPLFVRLKTEYSGSDEHVFEWLCLLTETSRFESELKDSHCLDHIGCIGLSDRTYFHEELLAARSFFILSLQTLQQGTCYPKDFDYISGMFHKLLFLFKQPRRSLVFCLKYWRDICGIVCLAVNCHIQGIQIYPEVKKYYPKTSEAFENSDFAGLDSLTSKVLAMPFRYPVEFFEFSLPLYVKLECNLESETALSRTKDLNLELTATIEEVSRSPRKILFLVEGHSISTVSQVLSALPSVACTFTVPLTFPSIGSHEIKVTVSILHKGEMVGKTEYLPLTIKCL